MKQNRYNELYKELNPSLKMKLNAIRMNLHEGKASCLVGAGFSKNAEMDDAIHMKDWLSLQMTSMRLYMEKSQTIRMFLGWHLKWRHPKEEGS